MIIKSESCGRQRINVFETCNPQQGSLYHRTHISSYQCKQSGNITSLHFTRISKLQYFMANGLL